VKATTEIKTPSKRRGIIFSVGRKAVIGDFHTDGYLISNSSRNAVSLSLLDL